MYGNRNQTLFPERKQMFGLGAATAADYAGLPTSLYATPTDPTFSASGNPFDINADRNSMEFTQALQYNMNYLESLKAVQDGNTAKLAAEVAYSASNLAPVAAAMGLTPEQAAARLVTAPAVSNVSDYVAGNATSIASNEYAAQVLANTQDKTMTPAFETLKKLTDENAEILANAVAANPNASGTIAAVINTPADVKITLQDLITTSMAAGQTGNTTTQKAALDAVNIVANASQNATSANIATANNAVNLVNTLAANANLSTTKIPGTNLTTGPIVVAHGGTSKLNTVTIVDANGNSKTTLTTKTAPLVTNATSGTSVTGVDGTTHTVATDGTIVTTVSQPASNGVMLLGALALGAFLLGKI